MTIIRTILLLAVLAGLMLSSLVRELNSCGIIFNIIYIAKQVTKVTIVHWSQTKKF